jgi:hypothetical protein
MSVVINKQTLERIESANTADYRTGDWWINPTEPDCPGKYWKNDNGTLAEMTAAEKSQVDEIELVAAKVERKGEVQADLKEYIERAYSEDEQRDFLLLLWLASEQGNQDAKSYIYPLIAWVQNGQTLMREAKQRIEDATDAETVQAAGYDYEAFYFWHQTMPDVTTQKAGEIINGES